MMKRLLRTVLTASMLIMGTVALTHARAEPLLMMRTTAISALPDGTHHIVHLAFSDWPPYVQLDGGGTLQPLVEAICKSAGFHPVVTFSGASQVTELVRLYGALTIGVAPPLDSAHNRGAFLYTVPIASSNRDARSFSIMVSREVGDASEVIERLNTAILLLDMESVGAN